jgi:hypothetical protein
MEFKERLSGFSIQELLTVKEILESIRVKYEDVLWGIAQQAIFERVKLAKEMEDKIRILEVEIDHQEKEIEQDNKDKYDHI